jgi:hypothetical protein
VYYCNLEGSDYGDLHTRADIENAVVSPQAAVRHLLMLRIELYLT